MKSRYDFMKEGKGVDSFDGVSFPDPLSVNYQKTQLTQIPKYIKIEQKYIDRFWALMNDYYGVVELDDILLTINNIPYVSNLEPGDVIFLVEKTDLENFAIQKQAT